MAAKYNPGDFENRIYNYWMENKLFHSERDDKKDPYTILIPPPNVTGVLHMGHGLNNTIQDILIRYNKMNGKNTLWMPGTDHAGIATQNVVERKLAKEKIKRHDLGREKFLKEIWKWKEENGSTIIKQLKKLGASCDWERERFTMDEGLSKAVLEVFVNLYEKDLIYKGEYIINWCPRCETALSDEEAEHQDKQGTLTQIRYPYVDGSGEIIVATTRPETMLGDTAVAVHPDDKRYKDKIGTMVKLPLTDREIPVIADHHVDMEFGTGAVKVTPAHDPNDFEIGNRHNLQRINIMTESAIINEMAPEKYRGMDRFQCRKAVVADLKEGGFFVDDKKHDHAVGHCYRCHTIVEPYLSKQWFVKMQPLARPAIKAVEENKIKFYPDRWKKVYLNWMNNIRDWCISRQIWWGHQIPAWYIISETDGKILNDTPFVVARSEEEAAKKAEEKFGNNITIQRDPDVLDTWFSSWLWPSSTFGWPDKNADLSYYYPTNTLVTDMGIIFFWVARMIMAGYFCMDEIPFRDVYIHGTVMDADGRKMSKSLGNGIDPLDVINEYGADALRYTIIAITPQGQNTLLSMDKFSIGSKFANKLWNASRYILMNITDNKIPAFDEIKKDAAALWIISKLNDAIKKSHESIQAYRFSEALSLVSHFFRDDFCDWYIEFSKLSLYGKDKGKKQSTLSILLFILKSSLKLLHPFIPFITEEIYQKLPGTKDSIMSSEYPISIDIEKDNKAAEEIELVKNLIHGIRNIRGEMRVPPEKKCLVVFKAKSSSVEDQVKNNEKYLLSLAGVSEIKYDRKAGKPQMSVSGVGKGFEFFIPLEEIIDLEAERLRLEKEVNKINNELTKVKAKLANDNFTSRAPEQIINKEKEKQAYYEETIEKLEKNMEMIK